jgi:hypothetical protein
VLLLLAEEKNKLVKNFKDITYAKFKDSYKCSRFVGQFITTIESLQNEHLKYPDQLKKIIRNYPCPKDKDEFEELIKLVVENVEAVYTYKRRKIILANEKYKIEDFLGTLDYPAFTKNFKVKKTWVNDFAAVVNKFSFKKDNLSSLQELLGDKLLAHRAYPEDKEEYATFKTYVGSIVGPYITGKNLELANNYHQSVIEDYVQSLDFEKFKKEFRDEKTFVEDIYNEMSSQVSSNFGDKDCATTSGDFSRLVKARLSYFKYPKNQSKFKTLKKKWQETVKNYFDRTKLGSRLDSDFGNAEIGSKNMNLDQFTSTFAAEEYNKSVGKFMQKFFEKVDASDLRATLTKSLGSIDYPKNNSMLITIKEAITNKLKNFSSSIEQKMFNEYCRKDLLDLLENFDYADFKFKFSLKAQFEAH